MQVRAGQVAGWSGHVALRSHCELHCFARINLNAFTATTSASFITAMKQARYGDDHRMFFDTRRG